MQFIPNNKEKELILLDLCKQCVSDNNYELIKIALNSIKNVSIIDDCINHLLLEKSNRKTVRLLFSKTIISPCYEEEGKLKINKEIMDGEIKKEEELLLKMGISEKEFYEIEYSGDDDDDDNEFTEEEKLELGKREKELYIKYMPEKIDHSAIFKLINDNNIKL